ncbi:MAG: hypothetical protein PHR35_05790, partial [Kiritimatiellae bacterium]|nr:hypothetical protein [Kiritimatiellia bacterium]
MQRFGSLHLRRGGWRSGGCCGGLGYRWRRGRGGGRLGHCGGRRCCRSCRSWGCRLSYRGG